MIKSKVSRLIAQLNASPKSLLIVLAGDAGVAVRRWARLAALGSLVVAALACAQRPPASVESSRAGRPAVTRLPEYRYLAGYPSLDGEAVGAGGNTPLSAVAFARLVLLDDAGLAFESLLREERIEPRIYGLWGLWCTDRQRYSRLRRELARGSETVNTFQGCIVGSAPVSHVLAPQTAGQAGDVPEPAAFLHAGMSWLDEVERRYRTWDLAALEAAALDAKDDDTRRWDVLRALAWGRGRPGVEIVFGCLDKLEPALRDDALSLLSNLPPWTMGVETVVAAALKSRNRWQELAGLRAIRALAWSRQRRQELQTLVPSVTRLLEEFRAAQKLDQGLESVFGRPDEGELQDACSAALEMLSAPAGE